MSEKLPMVSSGRQHLTRMAGIFFCCLTPALSLAAEHSSDAGLVLVRDGAPAASIVVAEDTSRAAQFAAAELRYHVQLITGAKLPILPKPRNHVEDLTGKGYSGQICGLGKGVVREEDARFATALRFSGTADGIWVTNNKGLDLPSSFTVALWLKPER